MDFYIFNPFSEVGGKKERMEHSYVHLSTSNNYLRENENHIINKDNSDNTVIDPKSGLLSIRALVFLLLWYIFSGCTLFLNKYILTYLNGNPTVLGKYNIPSIIKLLL